jgi:hypothetical protein
MRKRSARRGRSDRPRGREDRVFDTEVFESGEIVEHRELESTEEELERHRESSPRLTGGDVDADWMMAASTGDEAVGGSVATPDQDVVDEIGRALGVEQPDEAELRTSEEILRARDRFRWHLERDAEDIAEGRRTPRRKASV